MATTIPIASASSDSSSKFTKRLLPPSLASSTPHGPINKPARAAGEQAALTKRKLEILQSMNKEQVDAAYSGQAVKINEHLQRKAKKHAEIDAQLAQLKGEHDMEMRVIKQSLQTRDERREVEMEVEGSVDGKDGKQEEVERGEEEGGDGDREDGEIEMTT